MFVILTAGDFRGKRLPIWETVCSVSGSDFVAASKPRPAMDLDMRGRICEDFC
jgi:hypothetical protein